MSKISYSFYKVADITQVTDSKKIAGAIFFDDATETIHIYGAGGVPKIYGSRKWTWDGLNHSTFVKDVGVGDVVIWSDSEHQLVARKDVSLANTTKVMLMANTGFNTITFTTSNGGNTWSLTSSILEDFSDFIPNSEASVNPTANSVVKRDSNGDIRVHGIVDDTGNMYALPYSSEEVKDNADAILQMEITDLNTIRNNAKTAAEAIPDLEGDIEQLQGVTADIATIRSNAAKVTTKVDRAEVEEMIADVEARNKGYFISSSSLIALFPTGTIGDRAYVGVTAPFAIYEWNGSAWVDTGQTGGSDEVNTSKFLTAATLLDEELEYVEPNTFEGDLLINGIIEAKKFILVGASANSILMADGSTIDKDTLGSLKVVSVNDINDYSEIEI